MALCSLSRSDSQKWTIISQNPTWYCKKYISSMSSVHIRKKLRSIRTPALKSYNFLNPGCMTPNTWKAKSQTCLRLRKDTLSQLLSRAKGQTLRIGCHQHQLDDTRASSRRQEKCKRAAVLPESSCRAISLSSLSLGLYKLVLPASFWIRTFLQERQECCQHSFYVSYLFYSKASCSVIQSSPHCRGAEECGVSGECRCSSSHNANHHAVWKILQLLCLSSGVPKFPGFLHKDVKLSPCPIACGSESLE